MNWTWFLAEEKERDRCKSHLEGNAKGVLYPEAVGQEHYVIPKNKGAINKVIEDYQEPRRKGSDWPKRGQLNISKGNNWYSLKLIKFIQMYKFIMILRKKPFIGSFWRMLENQYVLKTD